jgi:hypothetical protein
MLVACETAQAAITVIALCIEHQLWPHCVRYHLPQPNDTLTFITIGIDELAIVSHRLCAAIKATPDATVELKCAT